MIRSIYAYHVKSRGWCDLGYNFLVDKFGRAWEGRYGGMQLPVLGAHTGEYNAGSFGVSLIGNYETTVPSGQMLERTARIIAWKLDANYRSPLGTVVLAGTKLNTVSGHRDTTATACPGNNLYKQTRLAEATSQHADGQSISTEIYRYAQQLGGYRAIGQPFWGEHPIKGGCATYFGARDIYWSPQTGARACRAVSGPGSGSSARRASSACPSPNNATAVSPEPPAGLPRWCALLVAADRDARGLRADLTQVRRTRRGAVPTRPAHSPTYKVNGGIQHDSSEAS